MKQLEYLEQLKVIQWRDANKHLYPKLKRLFHVPNGGYRSTKTAIQMSKLGQSRGVPDLILLTPADNVLLPGQLYTQGDTKTFIAMRGSFHFFCGEMKAPGGKLTKEQIEFKDQVIDDGGYYCVESKAVHMVEQIRAYLLIGHDK